MTTSGGADALPGDGRDETVNQKADRNWDEVLQELRVTQVSTQIIAGFLLAIAFQQRFDDLDAVQRTSYLALVVLAGLNTLLGIAPAAAHRVRFGRGEKPGLVRIASTILTLSLVTVSLLAVGVVAFLFDVVAGRPAGIVAGAVTALAAITLLAGVTRTSRREP